MVTPASSASRPRACAHHFSVWTLPGQTNLYYFVLTSRSQLFRDLFMEKKTQKGEGLYTLIFLGPSLALNVSLNLGAKSWVAAGEGFAH